MEDDTNAPGNMFPGAGSGTGVAELGSRQKLAELRAGLDRGAALAASIKEKNERFLQSLKSKIRATAAARGTAGLASRDASAFDSAHSGTDPAANKYL